MGSCMSSSSTTPSRSSCPMPSSSSSSKLGNEVRVVHMNGSMEEYKDPITVGEVMLKQPKHFVFAQPLLLSIHSKPLDSHAQLQLGNIYFLLPHSVFDSEMSPMDLATISKRLTVAAKKPIRHSSASPTSNLGQSRKVNRFAERYVAKSNTITSSTLSMGSQRVMGDLNQPYYEYDNDIFMKQKQQEVESPYNWKPILESITEQSFTLRSESDLQDYH